MNTVAFCGIFMSQEGKGVGTREVIFVLVQCNMFHPTNLKRFLAAQQRSGDTRSFFQVGTMQHAPSHQHKAPIFVSWDKK